MSLAPPFTAIETLIRVAQMEQRDVAALVGCSEAQVSRIVSGEQAGSPSLRLAIVRAITARLEDMAGSPA